MKTKVTLLALGFALFGFSAANAQSKGHSKKQSTYSKVKDHDDRYYDKSRTHRDRDYERNRYSRRDRTTHYPDHNVRKMPPGQAKKVYGHQSAKAFAPGQQKKAYNKNVHHTKRRVVKR